MSILRPSKRKNAESEYIAFPSKMDLFLKNPRQITYEHCITEEIHPQTPIVPFSSNPVVFDIPGLKDWTVDLSSIFLYVSINDINLKIIFLNVIFFYLILSL